MSDVSILLAADTRGVGSAGDGERAALEQVSCTCSCDGSGGGGGGGRTGCKPCNTRERAS